MIVIDKIYIEENSNESKLVCHIIENDIDKNIFFSVPNDYKKYLCFERADAFLIGILNYAMRFSHDIKSNVPITEELLYNINEYLIPSVVKNDSKMHWITINAPVEKREIGYDSVAVGTGISGGVDSFHCIKKQYNSIYKSMNITHLCINSVGSFHSSYKNYGIEEIKNDRRNSAKIIARELNLPLIITDSNIKELFNIYFEHSHTYYSIFAVYCLAKLWKTYYYASTYQFNAFSLKDNSKKDTAFYELLLLSCFSTRNLRLYSCGATENRLEKTDYIKDSDVAQKYLHVCVKSGVNCGICKKCRRTLLSLYALNKLDDFKNVFDIDYFLKNKFEYFYWLCLMHYKKDVMNEPIYKKIKNEIPIFIKILAFLDKVNIFSIVDVFNEEYKLIKFLYIKIKKKRH